MEERHLRKDAMPVKLLRFQDFRVIRYSWAEKQQQSRKIAVIASLGLIGPQNTHRDTAEDTIRGVRRVVGLAMLTTFFV